MPSRNRRSSRGRHQWYEASACAVGWETPSHRRRMGESGRVACSHGWRASAAAFSLGRCVRSHMRIFGAAAAVKRSPSTAFLAGRAQAECQLVGNVWEWTSSGWGMWEPAGKRVETSVPMRSFTAGRSILISKTRQPANFKVARIRSPAAATWVSLRDFMSRYYLGRVIA